MAPEHVAFCDLAKPLYFNNEITPPWLETNDVEFLKDVVAFNELVDRICME